MTPAPRSDRDDAVHAFFTAFDEGDFFGAHEVLEQFWVSYRGGDRDFYKGLIQAAVALHHASRGNAVGAQGVGTRARRLLAPYAPRYESVDVATILSRLDTA